MKKFIIAVLVLGVLFCSCQKNDAAVDKETINTAAPIPTVTTPITSETLNETDQQPIESDTVPPETSEPPLSPPPTEITTPTKMFVTINEACSSNKTCFKGSNGEHPDWIELYNNSDKAINLAGYGISDDKELPFRYTLSNYLIEAKSYVILLATGSVGYNKGVISLPFKLSSDGETIILTSPEGLCDILTVPPLREDTTYGRILDGGSIAAELTPTPLSTNNTATSTIKAPNPVFSHIGGFYSSAFELEISAGDGCSVYYTTDGSTPNSTSTIYNGPILLSDATSKQNVFSEIGPVSPNGFVTKNNQDKANIIRAIAFDENGNGSDIVSATYFVMEEERARPYENMPIISVYTDAHNLFDYEKGIYVSGKIYDEYMNGPDFDPETPTWLRPANYYLAGIAAERPATVEYFDAEHNIAFRQDVGIRIGGNASRANVQKSFKFYARSEYGKSYFDYPLFESGLEYDTFLLRSGANDMAKTKIRDVLTQSLIQDRGFATAKWQPCVMFLNGEYWGFYMMMERYDSDYFSDYYNIEKDDLVVIKTGNVYIGNPEDKEIYRDLRSFCKNNDLTLPENYEKLCSMIDIQSYIEYVAMNVIIN
ncbi:MAG: CotH kinase family protein, partial [Clostridia bacterium]|nr:CotH kinase family protein [Clostridia bacterium]